MGAEKKRRDETVQEKRGHEGRETTNYLFTRTQKREVYYFPPINRSTNVALGPLSGCACLTFSDTSDSPSISLCVYECSPNKSHRVLSGCQAQHCHTLTEPSHPSLSSSDTSHLEPTGLRIRQEPRRTHGFPIKGVDHEVTSHLQVSWRHFSISVRVDNSDVISWSRCIISKAADQT